MRKVKYRITTIFLFVLLITIFSTVYILTPSLPDISIGLIEEPNGHDNWHDGYKYRSSFSIDNNETNSNALQVDVYYGSTPFQEDGIFEWYQRPVYRYHGEKDQTFISYYTSGGTIEVRSWNDDNFSLSDSVVLWEKWGFTNNGRKLGDDHACPSLIVMHHQKGSFIDNNGKIICVASEHNCSTIGKGRLEIKVSKNPENIGHTISDWGNAVSLEVSNSSYPQVFELSDGSIYVFYRYNHLPEKNHFSIFAQKSMDSGITWTDLSGNSGRTLVFDPGPHYGYFMGDTDAEQNKIHCMFSVAINGYPMKGYARYKDIYYSQFDGKTWYKADGTTKIKLPLQSNNVEIAYQTNPAIRLIGANDSDFNSEAPGNKINYYRFCAERSGTSNYLKLGFKKQGNIFIAIYDDIESNGPNFTPGHLIYGNSTPIPILNGVLELKQEISFVEGEYYWLAVLADSDGVYMEKKGGNVVCLSQSQDFKSFIGWEKPNTTEVRIVEGSIGFWIKEDWTFLWDIKVSRDGTPFLMSLTCVGAGLDGNEWPISEVRRHSYQYNRWITEDICKSGLLNDGMLGFQAGAIMDAENPDIVYTCIRDDTGHTQLQKYEKNAEGWKFSEAITTGAPGSNMRPVSVKNHGSGRFQLLWSYVESYGNRRYYNWDSKLFAYPGYYYKEYLQLERTALPDFSDLRYIYIINGQLVIQKPVIEEKFNNWKAKITINPPLMDSIGDNVDAYFYWGIGE